MAQLGTQPGPPSQPPVLQEQIELFISCRDLIKMDKYSKSDPFVVVYLKSSRDNKFNEIGRTEVIYDNHYPDFSKQFLLDYYFEEEQTLRFDVYDEDQKESNNTKDHDFLGSCAMCLGEIIHEPGSILAKRLMINGKYIKNKKSKKFSHLIATVETVNNQTNNQHPRSVGTANSTDRVYPVLEKKEETPFIPQLLKHEFTFQFKATNLPKMGRFGNSNPYFIIERVREDNKRIRVYGDRENALKKTQNPIWPSFKIAMQTLCNNDEYRPLVISIYDFNDNGSDEYIGSVETNVNELKLKQSDIPIMGKNKKSKDKEKQFGEFTIIICDEYTEFSKPPPKPTEPDPIPEPSAPEPSAPEPEPEPEPKPDPIPSAPIMEQSEPEEPTFVNYLQGQLDMSLLIAIDYTASNQSPWKPSSLHFIGLQGEPSPYQKAIRQIGNILSVYDSDQQYPVWGFGGKINKSKEVSHCFNLKGLRPPTPKEKDDKSKNKQNKGSKQNKQNKKTKTKEVSYEKWKTKKVIEWIINIDKDKFDKKYRRTLTKKATKEEVEGSDLKDLTVEDLTRLGITKLGDKKKILNEIKTLTQKNDDKKPKTNNNKQKNDESKNNDNDIKNDNEDDAEVDGIYGVEQAYINSLKCVKLSKPTKFSPILKKARRIALETHNNFMKNKDENTIEYLILLIISDGVINDMTATKNQIVAMANQYLPISIIIVGVGDADFKMMDELDADDTDLVNKNGEKAERDIVQFVPMNNFSTLVDLSKETLHEVPEQFLSYANKHNIEPGKKLKPDMKKWDNLFGFDDDDDDTKQNGDDKSTILPAMAPEINHSFDNAPLPPGWEKAYDIDGNAYYIDHNTDSTQWDHPSAKVR